MPGGINYFDTSLVLLGHYEGNLECQSFPLGLVASAVPWSAVVSLPPLST